MLRIEGWGVKHKRVERIWRQEGLKVPERQPKRGRLWLNDGSCIRLRPLYRGHVWSYDFVASRTHDGRALKLLTVLVEQWRREYNTVRPHSACGGFPPAPEAIKPSPWFLRMPVLHGPPQVLGTNMGTNIGCGTALGGRSADRTRRVHEAVYGDQGGSEDPSP